MVGRSAMLDRRGPVYAQGTAPPLSRWHAIAWGADGGVLGVARNLTASEAEQLADRWMGLTSAPGLPGATSAKAEEVTI